LIKAFNTIGAVLLGNATFGGLPADGYSYGDDIRSRRWLGSETIPQCALSGGDGNAADRPGN
jgi:hypothetical protein